MSVGLTLIPLQLILRHGVRTAIKVFLKRVHLPAQDVSEGLHLRQLLPQAVTLLKRQRRGQDLQLHAPQFNLEFQLTVLQIPEFVCVCSYEYQSIPLLCAHNKMTVNDLRAHLEGGGGGGGEAAGGGCERQRGAMSPEAGLGAVSRISLRTDGRGNEAVTEQTHT